MARRVRVASRAIRRGRRLKARRSDAPPASTAASGDNGVQHLAVAAKRHIDDEEPAGDEIESGQVRRHSRPSEPVDGFDGADEPPSSSLEDELVDEPPMRKKKYSRPPAPLLEFSSGAARQEPERLSAAGDDEEADPNATTLVSQEGPRSPRPSRSEVGVVEADDEPPSEDVAKRTAEPGFVPEQDEPPISAPAKEPEAGAEPPEVERVPSSRNRGVFRQDDATPESAVDEEPEEVRAEAVVSPELARRRQRLRRGVGVIVAAAALVTLGLVARATISDEPAHAERHQATAAVVVATEAPAAVEARAPTVDEPVVADESDRDLDKSDSAAEPLASGEYGEVSKTTLKHLNDRDFEKAIPWANKLIEMRPHSAFGYRCLGSALQDLGRYAEAQKVYSQCVTNATKGEFEECGALGGGRLQTRNKEQKTRDKE